MESLTGDTPDNVLSGIQLARGLEWMERINCAEVNPDVFFPERGASTREAKEICNACLVKKDCLEYALEQREKFGIWGGISEHERRSIRRERAAEKLARLSTADFDDQLK